MRILAIRGARLASLEAPFEVDLAAEPLRSAGVFAITGPTGAGRSSLLDALCLALFADTPRLARTPSGQKLSAWQGLPPPGTTMRSARTIRARSFGKAQRMRSRRSTSPESTDVYRARWSVTRSKRNGRAALRTPQSSLLDVASSQLVAGGQARALAAIERKLGLEIRAAASLGDPSQNEFAAFLEAGSDERATLLERATGAEIFGEVAKVVHERAAAARRVRETSGCPGSARRAHAGRGRCARRTTP